NARNRLLELVPPNPGRPRRIPERSEATNKRQHRDSRRYPAPHFWRLPWTFLAHYRPPANVSRGYRMQPGTPPRSLLGGSVDDTADRLVVSTAHQIGPAPAMWPSVDGRP